MAFLKLVRWPNLLMIALTLCVVHYGFFKANGIPVALNDFRFILMVVATLFIAAGGYIINDIFDQGTDAINKPDAVIIGKSISEKAAYNVYGALTITGVGIGYYLADYIGRSSFTGVFIISAWILYLYASNFKQTLVGNILVSLLTSIVVLLPVFFDILPLVTPDTRGTLRTASGICLDFATFCFSVSMIREITKDLEDVEGDSRMGMNTLPIAFGTRRAKLTAFTLALLSTIALLWYIYNYVISGNLFIAAAFQLFGAVGPLVFFLIRILPAEEKKEFRLLGNMLKLALLGGILSLAVISLNMHLNAEG